jgi:hypothetical protein
MRLPLSVRNPDHAIAGAYPRRSRTCGGQFLDEIDQGPVGVGTFNVNPFAALLDAATRSEKGARSLVREENPPILVDNQDPPRDALADNADFNSVAEKRVGLCVQLLARNVIGA